MFPGTRSQPRANLKAGLWHRELFTVRSVSYEKGRRIRGRIRSPQGETTSLTGGWWVYTPTKLGARQYTCGSCGTVVSGTDIGHGVALVVSFSLIQLRDFERPTVDWQTRVTSRTRLGREPQSKPNSKLEGSVKECVHPLADCVDVVGEGLGISNHLGEGGESIPLCWGPPRRPLPCPMCMGGGDGILRLRHHVTSCLTRMW